MNKHETICDIIAEKRRLAKEIRDKANDTFWNKQESKAEDLEDDADRLEAAHKREVDAPKQRLAELDAKIVAKDEVLKRCAAFLGETIQCGVEGEMLDGRHVNVAASDLANDIDDLLKQRTEASHPDSKENEEVKIYKKYRLLDAKTGEEKHGKYFVLKIDAKDENERKCVEKAIEIYAVSHANRGNSEYANAVLDYLHGKTREG